MLTSLVLQFTALTDAELPQSLGRAAQALFYHLLKTRDPALATTMHNATGIKPYTVSNPEIGTRYGKQKKIEAGQSGWLRFTGFSVDVSRMLLEIAAHPPETIELDRAPFAVTCATVNPAEHPWAAGTSYQDFAAPFLLGERVHPARHITIIFESPTAFRSQKKTILLPNSEHVFGGLLMRWQQYAPIALHPEIKRFATETVMVSRYRLRTISLPYKTSSFQLGFIGHARYTAQNADRYWLTTLHLLANYAFFCGIGYQTTTGMGQARAKP